MFICRISVCRLKKKYIFWLDPAVLESSDILKFMRIRVEVFS